MRRAIYYVHMAHHAYVVEGERIAVMARAERAARALVGASADYQALAFDQLTIEQARKLRELAYQSGTGDSRVLVIYAARIFHEAQNALLKVFEEPPSGTTLILGVPSLGILLSTLRSRLVPLPIDEELGAQRDTTSNFLALSSTEREKYLTKLVERSKADSDAIKQEARGEATALISDLLQRSYKALQAETEPRRRQELVAFLEDLTAFLPISHERSAPLKLIFEHVLLVIPTSLQKPNV